MQRYFVESMIDKKIFLSRDDEHHLIKVMRKKENDFIICVYKTKVFKCLISSIKPLIINAQSEILENNELKINITLYMSLIRRERFELVLEKATELGVKKIIPLITKHTQFKSNDIEKRLKRWKRILKEASEQSERNIIPEIQGPVNIQDINKTAKGKKIFCYARNENLEFTKHNIKEKDISLCIGPEGGFDSSEVNLLGKYGFESVSLGKRILRAETAAIIGLSWIMKEVEL